MVSAQARAAQRPSVPSYSFGTVVKRPCRLIQIHTVAERIRKRWTLGDRGHGGFEEVHGASAAGSTYRRRGWFLVDDIGRSVNMQEVGGSARTFAVQRPGIEEVQHQRGSGLVRS